MGVRSPPILWTLLAIQGAAAVFFVYDSISDATGLGARFGDVAQMLEYLMTVSLVGGLVLTVVTLRDVMRKTDRLKRQVDIAAGQFQKVLDAHFEDWGLTPSEIDVAHLAIKGLSIAEMAKLRGTAEGTIKAHSAAVYRKAGVSGRLQLISLFIEELMADPVLDAARSEA